MRKGSPAALSTNLFAYSVKDYQNYSVNDFILDEDFQSWILNPDERSSAFWQSWILAHPEKALEIEEARGILHTLRLSSYVLPPSGVSSIWRNIQQGEAPKRKTSANKYMVWYLSAAAMLLISFGLFFITKSDPLNQQYSTAFGETHVITLPDSSTVILNANSSLRFASNWNNSVPREVWLEGEAFFSVIHKVNNQPFKVFTGEGVGVEVLGTTFNLYHRSSDTKVVLNSGKIKLSLPLETKSETVMMEPGDLVVYKKKNYSKRNVDPKVYASWTEKKIILDETSLQEMIQMAKDNYGIDIEVSSDKLLAQTVSGSMPIGDAENFVFQIAKAFQLKYEKQSDRFLISE